MYELHVRSTNESIAQHLAHVIFDMKNLIHLFTVDGIVHNIYPAFERSL